MYLNDMVDNPFSRSLNLLDAEGNPETVDQSKLPSAKPLFSPRVGFNWDVTGDKSTQVRGGTGIFTGKLPFVWLGNQVSGADDSFFQIMDKDFKWPQVWRTSLGVDHRFDNDYIMTVDMSYNKDI